MVMLKPKDMAKKLGVTVRTLQIWDKNQRIISLNRNK